MNVLIDLYLSIVGLQCYASFYYTAKWIGGFPGGSEVKNLPAVQETQVQSLG